MKIISVTVINVTSPLCDNKFRCKVTGRLVECTVLDVACPVTALMLLTLFIARIAETSI